MRKRGGSTGRAHPHRTNLRGWPKSAAEGHLCAPRGRRRCSTAGRCNSTPTTAVAIPSSRARCAWPRPLRAAKVHSWAVAPGASAGDGAIACARRGRHGRGRRAGRPGDAGVGRRLELLSDLVTGGTRVPAAGLAGGPRGDFDVGTVWHRRRGGGAGGFATHHHRQRARSARAGVPEAHWMRLGSYRAAARGFAAGTPDGLTAWLVLSRKRCRRARGKRCRSLRRRRQQNEAGDAPNGLSTTSARRPLARTSGYQCVRIGLRGWPRRPCDPLRP